MKIHTRILTSLCLLAVLLAAAPPTTAAPRERWVVGLSLRPHIQGEMREELRRSDLYGWIMELGDVDPDDLGLRQRAAKLARSWQRLKDLYGGTWSKINRWAKAWVRQQGKVFERETRVSLLEHAPVNHLRKYWKRQGYEILDIRKIGGGIEGPLFLSKLRRFPKYPAGHVACWEQVDAGGPEFQDVRDRAAAVDELAESVMQQSIELAALVGPKVIECAEQGCADPETIDSWGGSITCYLPRYVEPELFVQVLAVMSEKKRNLRYDSLFRARAGRVSPEIVKAIADLLPDKPSSWIYRSAERARQEYRARPGGPLVQRSEIP